MPLEVSESLEKQMLRNQVHHLLTIKKFDLKYLISHNIYQTRVVAESIITFQWNDLSLRDNM